jgi:hypothetical protein
LKSGVSKILLKQKTPSFMGLGVFVETNLT